MSTKIIYHWQEQSEKPVIKFYPLIPIFWESTHSFLGQLIKKIYLIKVP